MHAGPRERREAPIYLAVPPAVAALHAEQTSAGLLDDGVRQQYSEDDRRRYHPHLVPNQLPRVEHYHSGVMVRGPLYEGAALDITMLTTSGPLHLRDHYWSQETYESVLHQVGFERIVWHAMQVSAEGFETYGSAYWNAYLTHPHIVVFEAQR
jgi:hypothetical protein